MSTERMTDAEATAFFEHLDRAERVEVRDRHAVADIERAVHARADAEAAVEKAVVEARAKGVTWVEIAAALGVSHQAAMKRYRDKAVARR